MTNGEVLMVKGRMEKIVNALNVSRLENKGWKVFKNKSKPKAEPKVEEFDGVPAEIEEEKQ